MTTPPLPDAATIEQEICQDCGSPMYQANDDQNLWVCSLCTAALRSRSDLRNEALEEAARVALHIGKTENGYTYEGYAGTIADAIRALKAAPITTTGEG